MAVAGGNRGGNLGSSRAELAQEAKRLRLENGVSLHRLSAITGYSRPHVREVERADARVPSATVVAAIDKALNAAGRLSALREDAYREQQRRRDEERALAVHATVEDAAPRPRDPLPGFADLAVTLVSSMHSRDEDMERRAFLGGLGHAALALEAARHGLSLSFAERAEAGVDEWQEIVAEYGYAYQASAPAELLDRLMVDVVGLQYAVSRRPSDDVMRELSRVASFLASFMAMTVANLGDLRESRRWWRTARKAAEASGDLDVSLWVSGWEVVRAPYERHPLPAVIDLAEQAESRLTPGGSVARPALPQLFAGKAQSLALAGRHMEAIGALEQARESSVDLPSSTASYHDSLFGFADECLHFAEGFVFSHSGDVRRADAAQQKALALYPASYPRGPAQIELQRAFCLVRSGDVGVGADHALSVMTALPAEHHVRPVVDLGHKVLQAIPATEANRPGVARFREYLALPPGQAGVPAAKRITPA